MRVNGEAGLRVRLWVCPLRKKIEIDFGFFINLVQNTQKGV
jgi:hypothetical protein